MSHVNVIDVDSFRHEVDLTADPPTIDLTVRIEIDLSLDEPQSDFIQGSSSLSALPQRTAQKRPVVVLRADGPPGKKPRLSVPPSSKLCPASGRMRTPGVTPQSESKMKASKRPKFEVIELGSDDETEYKPFKRLKQEETTDSEEEYALSYSGFNLDDPSVWKSLPVNPDKDPPGLSCAMQNLQVTSDKTKPIHRHPDISTLRQTKALNSSQTFVWDALRMYGGTRNAKSHRPGLKTHLHGSTLRPPLDEDSQLGRLRRTADFREASGSINKIIQQGKWTIICSASDGGQPDEPEEVPSAYNREGSLMAWYDSSPRILTGHSRQKGSITKYYAVNDVKFDHHSRSFVSSSSDKRVKVWSFIPEDGAYDNGHTLGSYSNVPHDLAFKPGESILAVAERKIHIYSGLPSDDSDGPTPHSFSLTGSKKIQHNVGAMVWGLESMKNLLFASTEPRDAALVGYHKAIDVEKLKVAYVFDAKEAGDAMSLDPTGTNLVILTRAPEATHILRVYDVRRQNGNATKSITLKAFPKDTEGEVNGAYFSPDGIYLALARNDNRTHVYDSRMLEKGTLFEYAHLDSTSFNSDYHYGVVHAQWIESRTNRLGLVTGGNDGCIRLWDPLISADSRPNGLTVAESHSDVGYFTLGDRFKGENELIIGDSAGDVRIFNGHGPTNLRFLTD